MAKKEKKKRRWGRKKAELEAPAEVGNSGEGDAVADLEAPGDLEAPADLEAAVEFDSASSLEDFDSAADAVNEPVGDLEPEGEEGAVATAEEEETKPKRERGPSPWNIYTALMALSAVFVAIGITFMVLQLYSYALNIGGPTQ